jgi:2-polyprenyl-6-methoxyphenol hydroxylase-like FAD-dependent oxidoreductase
LSSPHAIVIGSGITGLAATLILGKRGYRVTLLERDAEQPTPTAAEAFESWARRGAPQVRHSHVFLGRLRTFLRDHHPEVLGSLLRAGARELRATERPPRPLAPLAPEPGDEDLVFLGTRRTTFEWVLRREVLSRPGVELVGGVQVLGLVADVGDPPRVRGVKCRIGDDHGVEMHADVVVDASGRTSRAPEWLAAIGARHPLEEEESSGVIYYTRFYRLRPGAAEPPQGDQPTAADWNWVKFAIFPADDGTFSITLAVPLAFPRLKVLAKPAAFDEMVRRIPGVLPWVEASEPLDDGRHPVQGMGGLINRLRRFVIDGSPVAVGFFVLGDAAYCTNPLYGRGCAQGFLHADFLAEALAANPGDLAAAAVALDRRARAEIEPFYRASVLADREAVRKAEGRQPHKLANRLRSYFFEHGVGPATRSDAVVYRAFMRMMNMLETPEQAFGRPAVLARSLWALARGQRFNRRYALPPAPDMDETVGAVEQAART